MGDKMDLEQLENMIHARNITLIKDDIPVDKMKGLYFDNTIIFDRSLSTSAEKICILAEELGHFETGSGDILDQTQASNRKQERAAHKWATQELITLDDIIKASKEDIHNFFELAEFLNVTEDFLREGIEILKEIYGTHVEYDGKVIQFEPLDVWEDK